MNWNTFRNVFFHLGCVSIHQVYAIYPNFQRNNFLQWVKKGYLVRLRQSVYAFPEHKKQAQAALYFAGRIYKPSYISLHTALAGYGLIPETVTQITSVTSLKTARFENSFGSYSYKSVRENLMFGYTLREASTDWAIPYALPEKAILDLLYLYPFYNTPDEIEALRIDTSVLHDETSREKLEFLAAQFQSHALDLRVRLFLKIYEL